MPFKADAFASASLAMPTRAIDVPDLKAWFDGAPKWTVRGLNANELAKVEMAERRGAAAEALVSAIEAGNAADITEGVRALLGRSDAIEPVYARQIEVIVLGSVEPKIEHAHAAKLGESYPVVFKQLFNAIMQLTGEGASVEKKPKRSGATKASEPPAP